MQVSRLSNKNSRFLGMLKSNIVRLSYITSLLLILVMSSWSTAATQLIENAYIVDGSGKAGFIGDVRFDKNAIIAIGDLKATKNEVLINGTGYVLAPGFIDTHSHHDGGLELATDVSAAISQGITTIVVGNDGSSRASLKEINKGLLENPASLNVASYTGHGSIRFKVMKDDYKREASADEITSMKKLLREDMQNGSLGLSTGLEYDPGIYSSKEEVIELAKVVSKYHGRYISHIRSEDRAFDEALEELIEIGRQAKLPVQVSHIKLASVDLWGQADRVISVLEKARAEGIDVTADIYPYTFWQSTLTVLLPERDFYDLDAARFVLEKLAPADGMTLADYRRNPSLVGKTIAEIAIERKQSNEETYLQLIRDAYEGLSPEELANLEEPLESVLGVSMDEADIGKLIGWKHTNICSDGSSQGHPRGFGAFPRAIRKYVREQKLLSIEEMIHKMTSLSAQHVGITGRGEIKVGYASDLVLFDLTTVTDRASIKFPGRLSEGFEGVWVNGKRVWQNQNSLSARPGAFISGPGWTGHQK